MSLKDGDIIVAMQHVIKFLIEDGSASSNQALCIWDQKRGSDQFENYVKKSDILKLFGECDDTVD